MGIGLKLTYRKEIIGERRMPWKENTRTPMSMSTGINMSTITPIPTKVLPTAILTDTNTFIPTPTSMSMSTATQQEAPPMTTPMGRQTTAPMSTPIQATKKSPTTTSTDCSGVAASIRHGVDKLRVHPVFLAFAPVRGISPQL